MVLFTPEERTRLREELILAARTDPQIIGAAITGSAAVGREDRWSDIDLALCLAPNADASQVIANWTERMYRDHNALEHLDVWRGDTLFRVFLLADTLQVDLAFWSATEFGATAPTFRLVFGKANERPHIPPTTATDLIGLAWVYALHVRSSLARGRMWQAEFMLSAMRDQTLALACLRHDLPTHEARGIDDLPSDITALFTETLACSLDTSELKRAFAAMTSVLLLEIEQEDAALAKRLSLPLKEFMNF
jgi:predicted nucleotidyltransferase